VSGNYIKTQVLSLLHSLQQLRTILRQVY
jgi:hypothetical protein